MISAKTHPSADAETNHNFLGVGLNVKLKRINPTIPAKKNYRLLRNPTIADDFIFKLNNTFKKITTHFSPRCHMTTQNTFCRTEMAL